MVHFKEFKNKQATMPEPGQQYNTFQLKSKKKKFMLVDREEGSSIEELNE